MLTQKKIVNTTKQMPTWQTEQLTFKKHKRINHYSSISRQQKLELIRIQTSHFLFYLALSFTKENGVEWFLTSIQVYSFWIKGWWKLALPILQYALDGSTSTCMGWQYMVKIRIHHTWNSMSHLPVSFFLVTVLSNHLAD